MKAKFNSTASEEGYKLWENVTGNEITHSNMEWQFLYRQGQSC